MRVEQLYTKCLAEAAYYIESEGEAVIIDPLRETDPYIERAAADNAEIKYIFLTHFHADFVSGQVDLAKKTGATIVFGPGAKTAYDIHEGKDNEIFKIGKLTLTLLHTPGHTLESSSYLLKDENGTPKAVFTGDTLFIGDVGRPDLAVKQGELTEEDLAKHLFHSLRNKLMTLPNDVTVYPGHGAGSACGKSMSKETFDTIGHQKEVNYALRADMTEKEFVDAVLDGLSKPPQYFPLNVMMNKKENLSIDKIMERGSTPLNYNDFLALKDDGALVLDVRTQDEFTKEFIPGSIFIGLNGQFAPWVGALIKDIEQKIILVVPEGQEEEAAMRLARIGYDNSRGYLKGGIEAWKSNGGKTDSIEVLPASVVVDILKDNDKQVIDVRKPGEYDSSHVEGVENRPLDFIMDENYEWNADKTYYIHCAGGYRSVIFESILKSKGIHNLVDIAGGYGAIKNVNGLPLKETACANS